MENKMLNNETAKLKDETINKGETVNKNQQPETLSDQELEQAAGGLYRPRVPILPSLPD